MARNRNSSRSTIKVEKSKWVYWNWLRGNFCNMCVIRNTGITSRWWADSLRFRVISEELRLQVVLLEKFLSVWIFQITWDISVPFFTIPINHVSEDGKVLPLLNVNPKGLSIAGVVTAILTLAVPLLSKPEPGMQYRSTSFIPIPSLYFALKQQIYYKYSRIIWWSLFQVSTRNGHKWEIR